MSKNNPIDIICLSETFIKQGDESNLYLKNFKLVSNFSRENQKRGGVCILLRKNLDMKPVKICKDMAIEKSFECCGVEIPLLNCLVICVYRIPNANATKFFENLTLLLHKLTYRNKNKRIIIAGDVNIDTLKPTKNAIELKNILSNYNLISHIDSPTRQKSCIDHIYSNIKNTTSEIHNHHLSDHNTCQVLKFSTSTETNRLKFWYVLKKCYHDENVQIFINCLSSLSWSDVYNEIDSNNAFNVFYDTFCMFYNLCFPMIKTKINANAIGPNWITKGIRKSCVTKRKLRYESYTTKSDIKKKRI